MQSPIKFFHAENLKKFGLALAIIIVMNVFFNVGVDTFFDRPEYNDYCSSIVNKTVENDTRETCEANEGVWYANQGGVPYCDYTQKAYEKCQAEFDVAQTAYNRISFAILTGLGTLVIVLSLFTKLPLAVMHGLLYGGVLSLLIGTMRYWNDMDDYLQFTVTGIALFLLLLVGIKKLKD